MDEHAPCTGTLSYTPFQIPELPLFYSGSASPAKSVTVAPASCHSSHLCGGHTCARKTP